MEIFKLRNLALGCFAFLISIYLSNALRNRARIIISVIAFLLLIAAFITYGVGKNAKILKIFIRYTPLVLGISLAFFISIFTFGNDEKIEEYFEEEYEAVLEITEIKYQTSYDGIYIAQIQTIDDKDYKTKISLQITGEPLEEGDLIKTDIRCQKVAYYDFYDKESIFTKGIRAHAEIENYEIIEHNEHKINNAIKKVRTFLEGHINESVNEETSEIIRALLLGDKSSLSKNVTRDFSRVGISHILALSGMHIALIVTLVGFILSLAPVVQRLKILIIILFTIFFLLLTGMSPSAMRAGIMVIIFHLLLSFRSDADTITSLFLSVSIICFFSPYSVFSISLILSFTALLALICATKFIYGIRFLRRLHPRPLRYIVFTIISTTAVMLFTLPIMFLYFGTVSLASPLMNIIIVPIFTVILYLSPFLILFSKIAFLRVPIGFILEKLVHFSLFIIHKVATLKYVVIPISGFVETIGVVLLIISVFAVVVISRKRVRFALLGILISITVFTSGVIFSYVKRFDEIAFSSATSQTEDFISIEYDNKLTVFSIGANSHLYSAYYLIRELEYTEIENLIILEYDRYLVSHFDMISDYTYVRNLYISEPDDENENDIFKRVKDIADEKNIDIYFMENKMNFGEISLDVSIKTIPRSAKDIICISALAKNSRFTYLGASSYELLDGFAENMAYASDIIVFGAYGPSFYVDYNYLTPCLDYCVFLGNSYYFASDEFISSVSGKEMNNESGPVRFIFK